MQDPESAGRQSSGATVMPKAGARNVLLITADQWRGDTLGLLGHPTVQTPFLDRLADEGTLFCRHYSTICPCGPARASLLTGLYGHNHRSVTNGTPLDDRFTNLALEVRAAGYDPVLFGYTDTSADPRGLPPDDPRLTSYEGVLPGFRPVARLGEDCIPWLDHLRQLGYPVRGEGYAIYDPVPDYPGAESRGPTYAPPTFRAEHSETAWLTDRVLEYLAEQGDRPWFVHLSYLRPHPPVIAPEPYNRLYDPAAVPPPRRAAGPAEEAAQHPFLDYMLRTQTTADHWNGGNDRPCDLGERDLRQFRATYYGMMTQVDDQLGRLFDWLNENGKDDSTLIVFTSDHGEQLGDHHLIGKLGYFEESFHVPLIVRDPDEAAEPMRGRVVDAFTESVDVMPMVLDWLGLRTPPQCDGHSLLPLLHGASQRPPRDAAHWMFDFRDVRLRAAEQAFGLESDRCNLLVHRGERFKYVHFAGLPPLLFDLRDDPGELRNLAGDPAYRDVRLACLEALMSWRMAHDYRALANAHLGPGGVVGEV